VRAFHVTCALREGSGVVLDAVVDKTKVPPIPANKDVVPSQPADAPRLDESRSEQQQPNLADRAGPEGQAVGGQESVVDQPAAEQPEVSEGEIKLVVLCRQHNPVCRPRSRRTLTGCERVADYSCSIGMAKSTGVKEARRAPGQGCRAAPRVARQGPHERRGVRGNARREQARKRLGHSPVLRRQAKRFCLQKPRVGRR
jgi:hypothetical protein